MICMVTLLTHGQITPVAYLVQLIFQTVAVTLEVSCLFLKAANSV